MGAITTEYVVPDPETEDTVPLDKVKSELSSPVTLFENVTATVTLAFVGSGELEVRATVGTTLSIEKESVFEAVLSLPAASWRACPSLS